MHYKNILALLIICVLSVPAFAYLGGGGVTLEVLDGLGGGGSKEVGGYTLKDLMGSPVTGVVTDAATAQYKLYIGGIYALQGRTGSVSLEITRDGSDIRLTWDTTYCTRPNIYVLIGSGTGEYVSAYDAAKWQSSTAITGFTMSSGYAIHANQVGAGGNGEVYYKALLPGASLLTDAGLACFKGAPAAGKVNYTLPGGNTFFALPLTSSVPIDALLGDQSYTAGSRIYKQVVDRSGFDTADYDGTDWSGSLIITPEAGYYFYNTGSEIQITLVGQVPLTGKEEAMAGGSSLFGVQFPTRYDFSLFGSGPVAGDRVMIYDRTGTTPGFNSINQSEFSTSSTRLSGMVGYYYSRDPSAATLKWTPSTP